MLNHLSFSADTLNHLYDGREIENFLIKEQLRNLDQERQLLK